MGKSGDWWGEKGNNRLMLLLTKKCSVSVIKLYSSHTYQAFYFFP